ncbi:TIGR03759 family integrating conjugative element protein [Pokkaliibacter sp. MBI-7]|uniref:TIGR03759 family integrating conjugative element protein n=1 Tax=Pokkaliibacter sp. MBI-7 TaxID=3040600 RepID=UPI00244B21B4|nr:TIGR03759 family integrating conjugative element protein [Pokkaliibacter sp. MBI-7]MDH2434793.1 TIGR03759 family integrating conjugative element protein [Pokkaliibacter sp. MBI-7]
MTPLKWLVMGVSLSVVDQCLAGSVGTSRAETSQMTQSQGAQSQAVDSSATAAEWGLSAGEWTQYQQAMAGQRGIWSPGLDPITTLGVTAKTDAERRRFAELFVKAEAARVEKELAFQKAVDAAWARLLPTTQPIMGLASSSPASSASPFGQPAVPSVGVMSAGRVSLFVRDNCVLCDRELKKLLSQNRTIDIYLVGSEGNDRTIQLWALARGISPAAVKSKQITLNHDNGTWASMAGAAHAGDLPGLMQQVAGEWRIVHE